MTDDAHLSPPAQTREQRGLALKKARAAAGLTAVDLAQRVNDRTAGSDITHHAIYSYERGKVLLSREVGLRIAHTLNLHPGELLLGDPDFATAPPHPPTLPAASLHSTPPPAAGPPAPAELAAPFSPSPVYPLATPGPAPELRIALSKSARAALPVGNVLYRLLGTAEIGRSSMHGYLDVFNLLLRDLHAALTSPAGVEVKTLGLTEGNDVPYHLLRSCNDLHVLVSAALRTLLSHDDPRSTVLYDACRHTQQQLGPYLRLLETNLRQNDRGLDVSTDAEPLLPAVPSYSDNQLAAVAHYAFD